MPGSGIQPGEVIGGNLLVERALGEGGMAEVFQVRDITDGARYALKVLIDPSDQRRKRILKEGELIAALDSPHVVRMCGELRVGGKPALLMELVRGPTLHRYLRVADPSLAHALALFRGIAMGVGTAHAMGVVHRDLKPANVLLHVEGNAVIPKVADFGVAKDLVKGHGMTKSGAAYGTPHYMAPEQLDDSSTVDRRADMWSLGVLLYRMVCGVRPFKGGQDLLLNVMLGRYIPPRDLRSDLPEEVVFAIHGLLETKVEKRIQDVPALLGVLEGHTNPNVHDELGSLAVRARKPRTTKPTALPSSALPRELRAALEARLDWERSLDDDTPGATFTPAPAPPKWVGESVHPRTMDPEDPGPKKRAEPPTPAPTPRVGQAPEEAQPTSPRSPPLVLGLLLVALALVPLLFAAVWLASG